MRKLELYIDSSLKEFKLFERAEELLRKGLKDQGEILSSIDKTLASNMFPDFCGLASILDTYQKWTDKEWSNFMIMMVMAYREKGKYSAVSCILASLGLSISKEVEIKDTKVNVTVPKVVNTQMKDQPSVPSNTSSITYLNVKENVKYNYEEVIHTCGYEWSDYLSSRLSWSLEMKDEPKPSNPEIGDMYMTYKETNTSTMNDIVYHSYDVYTHIASAKWSEQTKVIKNSSTPKPEDEAIPEDSVGATYKTYHSEVVSTSYDYIKQDTSGTETVQLYTTKVTIEIKALDSPLVSQFTERFYNLLPRVLWVHSPSTDYSNSIQVDTVNVTVDLEEVYTRTMYETSFRYSDTTNVPLAGWSV